MSRLPLFLFASCCSIHRVSTFATFYPYNRHGISITRGDPHAYDSRRIPLFRHLSSSAIETVSREDETETTKKADSFQGEETGETKSIGSVAFLLPSSGQDKTISSLFGSSSPVANPSVHDAVHHLQRKLDWFSDGLVRTSLISTPQEAASSKETQATLEQAECVVAMHLSSEEDLSYASRLFETRRQRGEAENNGYLCQFALQCDTDALQPMVGGNEASLLSKIKANIIPWSEEASAQRLKDQMKTLFNRWTTDDFVVSLLLFFQQCSPPETPDISWVQHSIDATWEKGPRRNAEEFYSMVTQCGDCIVNCVQDEQCKTCLDALTQVDSRDQVASYRTIVSYESDLLKEFSLCILQRNNIFQCHAEIPSRPFVTPMKEWRGKPLTKETARQILVAHLNDEDAPSFLSSKMDTSWKVAAGANVAYDQFPSQNQLFYLGVNGNSLWYDPVFRVETVDGRNVWAKRHYRVRDGATPGTFRFSVLDNGVTSDEFWTIVDAADDLSWVVFHYAGAAKAVGQQYLGGLLCTPSGELPPREVLEEGGVWDVVKSAGIEPWELFVVDNDMKSKGSLEAGPPPLDFYRKDVLDAKKKKKENA